jgi:hypothetical protein
MLKWLIAYLFYVLHNLGVSLDYGLSMLLWLHDEEPMTISSRCGLALRTPNERGLVHDILCTLGSLLNRIDPNHCELSIAADIERANKTIVRLTHPSTGESHGT